MRPTLVLIGSLVLLAGCAATAPRRIALAEQASKGVRMLETSVDARHELIEHMLKLERQRLDAAFDADVRAAPQLTPQWVIAARKAYAIGLDALELRAQNARDSLQYQRQNLRAVDDALEQLRRSAQIELNLLSLHELQPETP